MYLERLSAASGNAQDRLAETPMLLDPPALCGFPLPRQDARRGESRRCVGNIDHFFRWQEKCAWP